MFGRNFKVATAQSQNEVAGFAQATECQEVASKNGARVSHVSTKPQAKRHNKLFPEGDIGRSEKGFSAVSP